MGWFVTACPQGKHHLQHHYQGTWSLPGRAADGVVAEENRGSQELVLLDGWVGFSPERLAEDILPFS